MIENGKKVSISENENGITVGVDGQKIQAQNLSELRMKSPEAYGLYQQHFAGPGGMNRGVDAKSLLQDELRKMKNENAGNPQIQRLIEEMMRNVR